MNALDTAAFIIWLGRHTDALLFVAAMLFLLLADSLWGDRIRALIQGWIIKGE